jgi:hypothetical protein
MASVSGGGKLQSTVIQVKKLLKNYSLQFSFTFVCLCVIVTHNNLFIKPNITHKRLKVQLKLKLFYGPTHFGVVHTPPSVTTLKT